MTLKAKLAVFCAALVCVVGVFWMAYGGRRSLATMTYSEFLFQVRAGNVASVIVMSGNSGATQATCRLRNTNSVLTVLPLDYRDALAEMQEKAVDIEIQDSSSGSFRVMMNVVPFFVLVGIWILMIRNVPKWPRMGHRI